MGGASYAVNGGIRRTRIAWLAGHGRWPAAGLAATLLALFGVFAAACGSEQGSAPGPRLGLAGDEFDLGDIGWDQSVERTVGFRNDGQEPLTVSILKVRPAPDAACGCGVERSEVRPAAVLPGATGELVFSLRAPESMRVMGYMRDKMLVELQSNDPAAPERTITLIFDMGTQQEGGGSGDGP